jgi:hypothetical protein
MSLGLAVHRFVRIIVLAIVAISLATPLAQAAPPSAPGRAMDECLLELDRIGLYGPEATLRVAIDLRDAKSVTITVDSLLHQVSIPDACRSASAGFVAAPANPGHFGILDIQAAEGVRELASGPGGGSAVWTPRYDRLSIGQDEISFRVFLIGNDMTRLPIGEISVLLQYTPATR